MPASYIRTILSGHAIGFACVFQKSKLIALKLQMKEEKRKIEPGQNHQFCYTE